MTRYMGSWNALVIKALKRIIRYLKGKEAHGLIYIRSKDNEKFEDAKNKPIKFTCLSDSDFAGRLYDSRCTASYIIEANECGTISFQTKSHKIGVQTSTCHAEAMAAIIALHQLEWTLGLAKEIGSEGYGPVTTYQDNQSTIKLSINAVMHQRSKHFRVAMHYIQDLVARGIIVMKYLQTNLMKADLCTKPLGEKISESFLNSLGFGK